MEQELWYRTRELERAAESVPRCDAPARRRHATALERSRRIVGRAVVHVGELIAAERYVPSTR